MKVGDRVREKTTGRVGTVAGMAEEGGQTRCYVSFDRNPQATQAPPQDASPGRTGGITVPCSSLELISEGK